MGREIARNYVQWLFVQLGGPLNYTWSEYANWIEPLPSERFSAEDLATIPTVRAGMIPDFGLDSYFMPSYHHDGCYPPAWRGYAERVGRWFRLTKGSRVVTCTIWTHPLGGETRCDVDGEMFQTKAARKLQELLDASYEWKAAFKEKGWTD